MPPKVVLVLVYKTVCKEHDGYCSDPHNERETEDIEKKVIRDLPTGFDANEYFSEAEYDGQKVYLDVSDDRFDQYRKDRSYGVRYCCRTYAYLDKAFLITKSF